MVYVFVDIDRLSRTYAEAGILTEPGTLRNFFRGFNGVHPLINAIDTGSHDDGADSKIKGTLTTKAFKEVPTNGVLRDDQTFHIDETMSSSCLCGIIERWISQILARLFRRYIP